jgi:hypothetical protein
MFGTIDIPEGGKLPPAPTYLYDGKEVSSKWVDVTSLDYAAGRSLFVYTMPLSLSYMMRYRKAWRQ